MKWLIGILVLIIIVGVALILLPPKANAPSATPPDTAATTTTQDEDVITSLPDLISVGTPAVGAKIASPVTITGTARGTWYFEASFPIEIHDAQDKVIGQGHGEAQGDWMTEDFVPFTASVSFSAQPSGTTGMIVLKNDNPSGDPSRDKKIEIPVTF
jgi:hypothetical protein